MLILGGTKDRTGENHASVFSPLKIRPKKSERMVDFGTKEAYKCRGLWMDVLQVAKLRVFVQKCDA